MAEGYTITVDPQIREALRDVRLVEADLAETLSRGLAEAVEHGASQVSLAAIDAGLHRTGILAQSVEGDLDAPGALAGSVGVPATSPAARYAYLLTEQIKTIFPVQAKKLTIPIGLNLTGAGVARFPTVAALEQAFGQVVFVESFVGVVQGKTFEPYFVLKDEVTVEGRDVLEPTLERERPTLTEIIGEHVRELIED